MRILVVEDESKLAGVLKRGLEVHHYGIGLADDYLIKPFAFRELLARARALLRRDSASVAGSAPTIRPPGARPPLATTPVSRR